MRILTAFLLACLVSCSKEPVVSFDSRIRYATDLITDPATGDTLYLFSVPDAFTPNDDGRNEFFKPLVSGMDTNSYEMRISLRNGNYVFYTDDFHMGWDGRVQGHSEILPVGIYNADIRLSDSMGNAHQYSRQVALYR